MKKSIYKLLTGAIQGLIVLTLTIVSVAAHGQATYTFNYTGSIQTLTLPVGNWGIECWGANGGDITLVNGGGGKGGYSIGQFNVTVHGTQLNILVGGKGVSAAGTTGNPGGGGWNGGGGGGKCGRSGAGGGGASDIRVGGILATNRIIVAGGGGGAAYYSALASGGNGGGTAGQNGDIINSSNVLTIGGGGAGANGANPGLSPNNFVTSNGTATGGGGGGQSSGIGSGQPGTGGGGGGEAGGSGSGATGSSGGGGGGYAGGAGGTQTANVGAAGGGGSGYVGGVTNGTTFVLGQTGFVANPNTTGNGLVIIKELCNISLLANGVTGNTTICSGITVSLTTNAVNNYSWSTGATTPTIVVTPTVTTVYTLTAMSMSNCMTSAQVTVEIDNAIPALNVVNAASTGICPFSPVILTASGASTYSWTGNVQNGVAFTPTTSSGYTVTGYNACGSTTAATSVSVHPIPNITLSASLPSLCSTQSVSLCPSGGVSYTLFPPGTANCGATYPFSTTTYTAVGSSAIGCTNTAFATVSVETTPSLPPQSSHSLVCIGGSSTLSATGASNYSWMPGASTAPDFVVTPNTTTTYTITKWNANCVDTQTITVIVNQLPVISAIANPSVACATRPTTLAAGGASSFTWQPNVPIHGPNAAVVVVFPQSNTIYTLTASDGTCINTTTVEVITNQLPVISIVPSATSICAGGTVAINVSGADSYNYSSNPSTAPQLTATSGVVTLTSSTSYIVNGTVAATGCEATGIQFIHVNPLPDISVTRTPTLVCVGGPSSLKATSALQAPAHQYSWAHSTTGSVSVVNPQSTTVYTVTGTNTVSGCVNTQTVSVAVFHPTFSTIGDTAVCHGGSVKLKVSGASGYVWQPLNIVGQDNVTVSPTITTVYTVSAISNTVNGLSCPSEQTIKVDIYANPSVTASAQRTTVCRNEQLELYGSGAVTYTWSSPIGKTGATVTTSPLTETTYSVVGTDHHGCKGMGTVLVKFSNCPGFDEYSRLNVSIFPNPNNGSFSIKGADDITLEVINELGQVVKVVTLDKTNAHNIHVEGLAAGVYFLKGKKQDAVLSEKIVIQ